MSRIILALALACSASAFMVPGKAPQKLATGVRKQGQSAPLAPAWLLRLLRARLAALGSSLQHSQEEAAPAHWAPSHCLGCLSEPPPEPPIPPPLAIQVRPSMVATKPAATSPTRNQPTPAMAATRTPTP